MRQIEVSRSIVGDAPRRARAFVEALVADNLDIGRQDSVELIFQGHRRHWGHPFKTQPRSLACTILPVTTRLQRQRDRLGLLFEIG